MDSILSVRQVTEKVKQAVEVRFPYVWVQGEVTNLSRPSSGHVYFSLKEGDCLLNCVWFRGQQKDEAFDPLTGEVWEDGPRPSVARTMENGQTLGGHLLCIADIYQQAYCGHFHSYHKLCAQGC